MPGGNARGPGFRSVAELIAYGGYSFKTGGAFSVMGGRIEPRQYVKSNARKMSKPTAKIVKPKAAKISQTAIKEQSFQVSDKPVKTYAYLPKVYGHSTVTGSVIWRTEPVEFTFFSSGYVTAVFYDAEIVFAQDCRCLRFPYTTSNPNLPAELIDFLGLYYPDYRVQEDAPQHLALTAGVHFWQFYNANTEQDQSVYVSVTGGDVSDCIIRSTLQEDEGWAVTFTAVAGLNPSFWKDYTRYLSGGWSFGAVPPPYNPNIGIYASRHPSIAKACLLVMRRDGKIDDPIPEFSANICVNRRPYLYSTIPWEYRERPGCWYKEAILDLLRIAGFDWSIYTIANFGIPGDDEDDKFFINRAFTEQITIREAIQYITEQVGVQLYYDMITSMFTIRKDVQDDYIPEILFNEEDVIINIDSLNDEDIYSTYKAHYHDNPISRCLFLSGDHPSAIIQDKVSSVENDIARINYGINIKNLDMDCYRSIDPTKERSTEVMKTESWKKHYGNIECSKEYIMAMPGMAIQIQAPSQIIGDIVAEIIEVTIGETSITIDWEQVVPLTSYYSEGGGGETGFGPADIPIIDNVFIWEFPQNTRYEKNPEHMFLFNPGVALQIYLDSNQLENFRIMLFKSETLGGSYTFWKYLNDYSRYWKHFSSTGLLSAPLPSTGRWKTYPMDPEYIEVSGLGYEFDQISSVLLKINDEFIYAETFTIIGGAYRFHGYMRAQMGSAKASHFIGASVEIYRLWTTGLADDIWFGFDIDGNPIDYFNTLEEGNPIFIKPIVLMENGLKISSIEDTPVLVLTPVGLATIPYPVGTIIAVRSGATVNIEWNPRSPLQTFDGAGVKRAGYMADHDPPLYTGSYLISINGGGYSEQSGRTYVVVDASSFTISIKQKESGVEGPVKTVTIGTTDGTYIDGELEV